ncbi:GCN5-related N-acetyltransferase OS=Tsukamurella paurometabola (strain ATCC 8368 / DSM / CCUG 35730 / CIP 100753 / JCM 10117 / KCTC 9821 / NBRC 16120 /NCIMB 702349 / NCTC 13040) OX=521096 GN=Tpau_0698 PE=4 SV=1 [Tsukamurella paurometabola]|uniref:GCN5-related N-acetyltransferase n=1 Tax=Tsukamurella paurometabola (strain ATCC 8368 / DSM 20162 / CCUG 35730 / CIP 100753 / JCM 10117 / KCTC 9821 / NBRC 16120 / NCIMB 702349 / NCTC 13040) TaxID=521096 RepID=D5UT48_TSUPD|nr:GNAT family N-acetyltransferase [Tsukamurella paurometabola]ADG77335.1 GCN5-related N-acetyltransferase [Tsukamurella paurometabola DSM 20162]SUP43523.1 Predicted acetyltransferase [Tsukamurella paurometabola]
MDAVVLTRLPDHPDVIRLNRDYLTEVVSRWYGRPAARHEIEQALADEPASDLVAPSGHLAVIELDGDAVCLGGLRFIDADTAELTKIYTAPRVRGRSLASRILAHLEGVAAFRGRSLARLDTRSDLVEACRLYESRGYRTVPPFSAAPYSDRWYAKDL